MSVIITDKGKFAGNYDLIGMSSGGSAVKYLESDLEVLVEDNKVIDIITDNINATDEMLFAIEKYFRIHKYKKLAYYFNSCLDVPTGI